jgi:hypothetical protein
MDTSSSSPSHEHEMMKSKVEHLIDKLRGIGEIAHQLEDTLFFLMAIRSSNS